MDYSTLILNIIFYLFIFCISNLLFKNINLKIFFCISFSLPLLILSLTGINNENIFLVFIYLISYIKRPKIYLFKKF